MARSINGLTGPIPVEVHQHRDKRLNIPTADAQEFVAEEHHAVPTVVYERDPSLDPQLVWRDKFEHDVNELVAEAPPIYIQEKVDARVLVENLRRTASAGEAEPEATLFDSFDGLDELDSIDFYQHQANWSNRMILGDSLQVMASLAERESLRGQVQAIYIDPPYGIRFGSNWQASARNNAPRDGKLEDAAREAEQIKAFRDTWQLGIHSYLSYLRDRLIVARDLLSDTGSVFVQIGDENVHLVRSLLDEVFGSENFVRQIAARSTGGQSAAFIPGTLDFILWYGKRKEHTKFRPLYHRKEVGGAGATLYTKVEAPDGTRRPMTAAEKSGSVDLPNGHRAYGLSLLVSQTVRVGQTTIFPVTFQGRSYQPTKGGWKTNPVGMDRLLLAGRVDQSGASLGYVRYVDDFPAHPVVDIWMDTMGQSKFGGDKLYVVQTANRIIERCILMTTDPGDLVLDPTCGSGTTAYVAEQWGRRWITVDTSRVALALARQRLMGAKYPYYLLADSLAGRKREQALNGRPLLPAQTNNDLRHGFVYERIPHITLRSIANNPEIREGMSRGEVNAAIMRHAEFEPLYDAPFEDSKRIRVSGPFTVESLSPHRSLAFSLSDAAESMGETTAAQEADSISFEQSVLDNLTRAGIQNGRRAERIEFSVVDRYPGAYVQAIGERSTDREGGGDRRRLDSRSDFRRPPVRDCEPAVHQGRST